VGCLPTKPVFRIAGGGCLTGNVFKKDIKSVLGEAIDYDERRYLSHSFRVGTASMMAAAGYWDNKIMRQAGLINFLGSGSRVLVYHFILLGSLGVIS
jgi:hypothetical protein